MNETFVSKTVSLSLTQVQWLSEKYGNVTKGIQQVIQERLMAKTEPIEATNHVNDNKVKGETCNAKNLDICTAETSAKI